LHRPHGGVAVDAGLRAADSDTEFAQGSHDVFATYSQKLRQGMHP
jgi:hypothetical protein